MKNYSVFIIDDDQFVRNALSMVLKNDYDLSTFETAEDGIAAAEYNQPDVVFLDIGLPEMSGVEAIEVFKKSYPEVAVIMLTAYEDVKSVVSSMKAGAREYIVKPVQMETVKAILENTIETISLRKEVRQLQEKYLKENLPCFIGESNAIKDIMEIVNLVAQSQDTPILIQGDTGTGKELIAQAIHYRSPLFKGPLVEVNCAAIPKELIESELFGYEEGAFSGAAKSGKKGLVEKAHEGTLFLDEIGDLSHEAQAKLLRFLEEGEFYRVGGTAKLATRTRVVSATNKNLLKMVDEGSFRKDLYFRLAVIKIELPSLNERKDDILPIAKRFLLEFSDKFKKSFNSISLEASEALKANEWTGNVRELRNIVERAVLLSDGPELTLDKLGINKGAKFEDPNRFCKNVALPKIGAEGINYLDILTSIESYYFKTAIELANGNETRAADLLHLTRDTFRYRRKKISI